MTSSSQNEVFKVLRESQNKYVYFLLAIAGAAIAFALTQNNSSLEWNHLPIGLGILSCGVSFYFGCVHMNYVNSSLYVNFELLKVQSGRHPQVGEHPEYINAAREVIFSDKV